MAYFPKRAFLFPAAVLILAGCAAEPQSTAAFKIEHDTAEAQSAPTPAAAGAAKPFKVFRVYTDANSPDNHYAPSGWMGDWGDIKLNTAEFDNPHSGATCLKVAYAAEKKQGADWAGIYWQNPPNNWGGQKGGYDLRGAKKLVFWARGENGGEKIEEFRAGGIAGENPDSDIVSIGPVFLTREWKQYEIDLADRDMESISGGFMWSANIEGNPKGFTIYFDDIRYE